MEKQVEVETKISVKDSKASEEEDESVKDIKKEWIAPEKESVWN